MAVVSLAVTEALVDASFLVTLLEITESLVFRIFFGFGFFLDLTGGIDETFDSLGLVDETGFGDDFDTDLVDGVDGDFETDLMTVAGVAFGVDLIASDFVVFKVSGFEVGLLGILIGPCESKLAKSRLELR